MQLGTEQKQAVELICSGKKLGIVTGGPGTGKTTVLRSAAHALALRGSPFILLAPTGKAARRITEVTSLEASTIHRALAITPQLHGTVIIDESSMVDTELLGRVVRSLSPQSKLVLIGDANQLPSVSPGRVFGDLIESGVVPVVRLLEVHRAAQDSWVCKNAPKILKGDVDLASADDFVFIERKSANDVTTAVLEQYRLATENSKSVQVLTPQNQGLVSTSALNKALQGARAERLRPAGVNVGSSEKPWMIYSGDPLVQLKNNYQTMVFNGEIGTAVLPEEDRGVPAGMVGVQFDSRILKYAYAEVFEMLRHAYALTVHKSQGSEWDTIILVCHSVHSKMWSRQLLYTAVTRAKKKVVLIGERSAIAQALRNDRPANRLTTLKSRILGGEE